MLLTQTSEANSEPSQAYEMGILANIVNGSRLILAHTMGGLYEDINVLFVLDTWISNTSDPTDLKTKKSPFVSYLLITWIMSHCIQGSSRIFSITRTTWITRFLFISCFDQFCLYFPKSNVDGHSRVKRSEKYNYVIKRKAARKYLL